MSSYVIITIPRGNRVYATSLKGAKVYIKPGKHKARRSGPINYFDSIADLKRYCEQIEFIRS